MAGTVGGLGNSHDAEEAALWQSFVGDPSDLPRARIFSYYASFARRIARRFHRERSWGDIEFEDLEQCAFAGLLEAINRFDPSRGAPFRPFAARRIAGNIRDGIPHMSEMREQMSWRARIRRERISSLDDPEGSAGASAVDRLSAIATGLAVGFMLEGSGVVVHGLGDGAEKAETAYDSFAWKEVVTRLESELAQLPEREQLVLREHYGNGAGFEQIGNALGLTKGRVSQLHRAALTTLRKRLRARGLSGTF